MDSLDGVGITVYYVRITVFLRDSWREAKTPKLVEWQMALPVVLKNPSRRVPERLPVVLKISSTQ